MSSLHWLLATALNKGFFQVTLFYWQGVSFCRELWPWNAGSSEFLWIVLPDRTAKDRVHVHLDLQTSDNFFIVRFYVFGIALCAIMYGLKLFCFSPSMKSMWTKENTNRILDSPLTRVIN
jgi:hypothetical protein